MGIPVPANVHAADSANSAPYWLFVSVAIFRRRTPKTERCPMVREPTLLQVIRSAITRGTLTLTCVIALTGCGSPFGRSLVNGYYVSHDGGGKVVMIHLVEAPRGHLSGALVVTSVNQGGSALDVTRITIRGSISRGNVALHTPGLFGHFRTVYVGSLDGERLILSLQGHSPFTLYRSSVSDYKERLAALDHIQGNINAVRTARHVEDHASDYLQQLYTAIEQYLSWGRARIAHQANVRTYWQRKAKFYDTCLTRIRPLAAAGVPSWRWQECAITVSDDAYYRAQAVAAIRELQRTAREKRAAIEQMLTEAPITARTAATTTHSVCPVAPHPKACKTAWRYWRAKAAAPVAPAQLAAFRALLPQVSEAIRNDAQTAETTDIRLAAVAAEISRIYRNPRHYRRT